MKEELPLAFIYSFNKTSGCQHPTLPDLPLSILKTPHKRNCAHREQSPKVDLALTLCASSGASVGHLEGGRWNW